MENVSPFDAQNKEAQLRSESQSWDTNEVRTAQPGDIPLIDVGDYFTTQSESALEIIASELRDACIHAGFFSIVGP